MPNENHKLKSSSDNLYDFINSVEDSLHFDNDCGCDLDAQQFSFSAADNECEFANPFVRDQLTQAYQTWQSWKRTDPEQLRREVGMSMTGKEVDDVNNQLNWLVDNYDFVKFLDDAIDDTIGSVRP